MDTYDKARENAFSLSFFKKALKIVCIIIGILTLLLLVTSRVTITSSDHEPLFKACETLTGENIALCNNRERRHQELLDSHAEIKQLLAPRS